MSMCVETAFTWTWLMTDFLYENSEEGHPCDMAEQQQAVCCLHLSVADGVIHLLLKIKASQIAEMKNKALGPVRES